MLIAILFFFVPIYAQKFAVIGDYGWNPSNPNSIHYQEDRAKTMIADKSKLAIEVVANMVKSWNPDFIVSLGDDSYWCRLQNNFADNVQPFYGNYVEQSKFFPILGNHDYKKNIGDIGECERNGKNGEALWKEYFSDVSRRYLSGSKTYYDFIKGDIHFFAMDFNPDAPDGRDVNSKQAQWLKAKLKASTSKFKIVYGHLPVYASCPSGDTHCSNRILQWPFQEWGADIVMGGDNHYYERNVVDNFTYIVNGVGGAKLDYRGSTLQGITKTHFPKNSSDKKFGAMKVEVKYDNGYYLDVKMYSHIGAVQDRFVVLPNKAQWLNCNKN